MGASLLAGAGDRAITGMLYFFQLGSAPMMVGGDEAYFASHAHAIATNGRDLDGRFLPLFFRIDIRTWYQPLLVYLMAAVFSVVQVSEVALRTPTALIGDRCAPGLCGRLRLLRHQRDAVIAAIVMALTPAHFILARQGLDYIAPLPFVLGWLWCLLVALDTGRASSPRSRPAAGHRLLQLRGRVGGDAVLPADHAGRGQRSRQSRRSSRRLSIGFVLPLLLLVAWLRPNPTRSIALPRATGSAGAGSSRTAFRYFVIQRRLSLFWDYFDPVYLFLAGSPNVSMSTGKAGVFLLSCAVLIPVRIFDTLRRAMRA